MFGMSGRLASQLLFLSPWRCAHACLSFRQLSRACAAPKQRRCQHSGPSARHWRVRRPAAVLGAPAQAEQEVLQHAAALHSSAGERMSWEGRTADCGAATPEQEGDALVVCGWVHRHRNLGGVCFMDVRDSSGLLQVRPPHLLYVRSCCVCLLLCSGP